MLFSVLGNSHLEFMFSFIQIALKPFLIAFLHRFKTVGLDFIFRRIDKLLLNIIFLSKAIKPESIPNISKISDHRERTCLE